MGRGRHMARGKSKRKANNCQVCENRRLNDQRNIVRKMKYPKKELVIE